MQSGANLQKKKSAQNQPQKESKKGAKKREEKKTNESEDNKTTLIPEKQEKEHLITYKSAPKPKVLFNGSDLYFVELDSTLDYVFQNCPSSASQMIANRFMKDSKKKENLCSLILGCKLKSEPVMKDKDQNQVFIQQAYTYFSECLGSYEQTEIPPFSTSQDLEWINPNHSIWDSSKNRDVYHFISSIEWEILRSHALANEGMVPEKAEYELERPKEIEEVKKRYEIIHIYLKTLIDAHFDRRAKALEDNNAIETPIKQLSEDVKLSESPASSAMKKGGFKYELNCVKQLSFFLEDNTLVEEFLKKEVDLAFLKTLNLSQRKLSSTMENGNKVFANLISAMLAEGCDVLFRSRLRQGIKSSYDEFKGFPEDSHAINKGRPDYSLSLKHAGSEDRIPLLLIEEKKNGQTTEEKSCNKQVTRYAYRLFQRLLHVDSQIKRYQTAFILLVGQDKKKVRFLQFQRNYVGLNPNEWLKYTDDISLLIEGSHDFDINKVHQLFKILFRAISVQLKELNLID